MCKICEYQNGISIYVEDIYESELNMIAEFAPNVQSLIKPVVKSSVINEFKRTSELINHIQVKILSKRSDMFHFERTIFSHHLHDMFFIPFVHKWHITLDNTEIEVIRIYIPIRHPDEYVVIDTRKHILSLFEKTFNDRLIAHDYAYAPIDA